MTVAKKLSGLLLMTALCVNSASASGLIDATAPERILEMVKGFGSAALETDSEGDPKIVGRIDGTRYGLFFYGCKANKDCDDIQLNAAWSGVEVTNEDLNNWNRKARYSKAYLDNEGDPVLEMTVNLDHGVSARNLEDSFNWWNRAVKAFKKDVLKQ